MAVSTGSTVALRYEVCDMLLDLVLQHIIRFAFLYKNVLYTFTYFDMIHKTLVWKADI